MSALIVFGMTLSSLLLLPLMMQPLSLGLIIMISTLLMCFISAMTLSSWYGYILFLIYVGGLLVMFAYVAALSPNVLFGKGTPMIFFLIVLLPISIILYFLPLIDLSTISYFNLNELKLLKVYGIEMVAPEMISVLIGLAIILLVNLIVVVKICYYQHASLRPFDN
uniref:NADH dehydrogenase subunit 6 n=1 Tax=Nassarius fraterculus TaxID=1406394 RepID=A0A2S0BEY2_9CAEN|nr:NADH dehydrogenase subunit 6 [Nassarius fraterculus]YP_010360275.1 NADH dehydrogenase subunit 6 [Nassarius gregarius]ANH54165.1 NADH dehydrogenase subunit 6 [Nassarius fraterculus]UNQ32891.1 NADH dehydrogenase subunit 6 [Nassarius gregarius]